MNPIRTGATALCVFAALSAPAALAQSDTIKEIEKYREALGDGNPANTPSPPLLHGPEAPTNGNFTALRPGWAPSIVPPP